MILPFNEQIKLAKQKHMDIEKDRNSGKYLDNEKRWSAMFNISKLKTNDKKLKFSGTIMTDGVAVSVIYKLDNPKDNVIFSRFDQPIKRDETNYQVMKGIELLNSELLIKTSFHIGMNFARFPISRIGRLPLTMINARV